MNLSEYNPSCVADFEILIDRWVDSLKNVKPQKANGYNKENHFKEILVEVFRMGLKAGQMPCNIAVDLKSICDA